MSYSQIGGFIIRLNNFAFRQGLRRRKSRGSTRSASPVFAPKLTRPRGKSVCLMLSLKPYAPERPKKTLGYPLTFGSPLPAAAAAFGGFKKRGGSAPLEFLFLLRRGRRGGFCGRRLGSFPFLSFCGASLANGRLGNASRARRRSGGGLL